jgi:dethiobiotin synthetase
MTAATPPVEGTRPRRLVVVTGTGTEVGKTWTAAAVLRALRAAGTSCSARKPAQSFEPGDPTTDARELAAATGEDPDDVCPPGRRYPVPMAPPMAADSLGRPRLEVAALVAEVTASWPTVPAGGPVEVGLVELAGGVRSPQAHDGDALDVIDGLAPDLVVLVADAGLGTVHAVRSALDALATPTRSGAPRARAVVHLNRYDAASGLNRRNLAWLTDVLPAAPITDLDALAGVVAHRAGAGGSAGGSPGVRGRGS